MLGIDMPRDGYYPSSTVYLLSQRIETLEAQLAEAREDVVSKRSVVRAIWEEKGQYTPPLYNFRDHWPTRLALLGITPDLLDTKGQDDEQ